MRKRTSPANATDTAVTASSIRATADGTARYGARHAGGFQPDFYRCTASGLTVSSVGIGTYLGESTDEEDARYAQVVRLGLESGINIIDTSINYRCQRSERAVGTALAATLTSGRVGRDEVVICSKGGYIPLADAPPASRAEYEAYLEREYFAPGIVHPDDVVAGGHSLASTFLKYCIARSRQNLGVRTIDTYYLHNPEQQLAAVTPPELYERMRAAFEALEDAVDRRDIGVYGVATWNGLRVPPGSRGHLSLAELARIATEVAGDGHHFRMVQLPVNLAMAEAVRTPTQLLPTGDAATVLEAADELGLSVVASASLMQGQLARDLPEAVRGLFPDATSDMARALGFVRCMPGVTTALVGTTSTAHLREALESAQPPR